MVLIDELLPKTFGLKELSVGQREKILSAGKNTEDEVYTYGWWRVNSYHYDFELPITIATLYTDKWIKSVILALEIKRTHEIVDASLLGPDNIEAVSIQLKEDEVFPAINKLNSLATLDKPRTFADNGPDAIVGSRFEIIWATPNVKSSLFCYSSNENESLDNLSRAILNTINNVALAYGHDDFLRRFNVHRRYD